MDTTLPRIQHIHRPLLKGRALLLLPDRVLVRWPDRVPPPAVGARFTGTTVSVPPELAELVHTVLFAPCVLARCDAAKRLSMNKEHRRRILRRLFSRSYIQQMLASAERIQPELREQIEALGGAVPLRRVFRAAYAPTLARQIRRVRL